MPLPKISPRVVDVVVDSGAQSCLWSRREFIKCGFDIEDLIPVNHSMKAANAAPITIDGAIFSACQVSPKMASQLKPR